jgi:Holliday junction DNA helicase RuvB
MGKSAGREARPATPGAGVLPNLGFRFKCGNPAASRLPLSAAFALSLTVRFRIFAVMDERAVSTLNKPDVALELTLRPSLFSEFTGQLKVKERLGIAVQAAKQRSEALDHILLSGPPGLGKTTLAYILAKAMGANLKCTSGPTIEKAGDLAGLLTNLEEGDVLFIDEIHRLQKTIEEYLYPAMEDFKLDIIIDQGPNARSVRLNLPRFTLIGATTRSGLLTAPLLTRFPMRERLDYYHAEQLQIIIVRSARLLNVEIEEAGAHEIARRSRGTPRIANNLLRRVRDYAQVRHDGRITADVADKALAMLEIDQNGLDEMDKRILEAVIVKFGGGPVGVNSLAVAVGEEPDTIEEVYEPYLIMEGYLNRTPQGRVATELSYKKLGLKAAAGNQSKLF